MTWKNDGPGHIHVGDACYTDVVEDPTSVEELAESVRKRASEGLAIYPVGAGLGLDQGGIPSRFGAAIRSGRLARVVDYPAADMTITVEAGMTLGALQGILDTEGQRLPLDVPDRESATLGGIFATNTSGPRRFGAGRPRDLILGMKFVDGSGTILKGGGRVVKNVAGYDLPKLMTGSFGTLGIIAELTLKVRPKPEASAMAWMTGPSIDAVSIALERLNTSRTRPMAIELLNPMASTMISRSLDLPGGSWTLAIGFEDNAASVAWQLAAIREEFGDELDVTTLDGEAASPVWTSLANFPGSNLGSLSIVASLPGSAVGSMAASLDSGRWAIQAHAGNGILRAACVDEITEADAVELIARLRAAARKLGGSVILARCPTIWKPRLKVWGEPRSDWALMTRIKNALDPAGVMNPGRFVGTI